MTASVTTTACLRLAALVLLAVVWQGSPVLAGPVPGGGGQPAPLDGSAKHVQQAACADWSVPVGTVTAAIPDATELALLVYREDRLSDPEPVAEAFDAPRRDLAAPRGAREAAKTVADPPTRAWPWRRATLPELAGITAAAAGTLYIEAAYGEPRHAGWTSHNGFDEGIRSALRLEDNSARDTAATLGDMLMGLLIAEPIVDSFATLGYRDRNWDALWQSSVINLESFTFTALVSSVLQNSIKREKPFQRDCVGGSCADEQPNRGLPSGHVAFAFTGAGLYCTHHAYQSLYDPATERALCAASLGVAAADGVLRIMADRHYATDVLAGSAIGLFSGFMLPRLLHYYWSDNQAGEGRSKPTDDGSLLKRASLSPELFKGGGGLNCTLRF